MRNGKRVVLAMSGGVDSSVAARLLLDAGYDVVGLFMRTGVHAPTEEICEPAAPSRARGCCSAVDAADAQRVADRLDIPFYALNFEEDFARIKDYFADEYLNGRTPNPCVVCNTWLKFGRLWEHARSIDADYIATGHYARIVHRHGRAELHRGADPSKDQSYFLFGIDPAILPRILFPIGDMHKPDVRGLAEQHDLGVHQKPDSQEVCFVPSGRHADFIRQHRPEMVSPAGDIVDEGGRVVGQHDGIATYTIGQRRGLGVALGQPRYVLSLEPDTNRVVIGPQELLLKPEMIVERTNWLADEPAGDAPIRCDVKIRYLHRAAPALIHRLPDGRARVVFDEPQAAVAPGQASVFYDGDRVLGGGWIVG